MALVDVLIGRPLASAEDQQQRIGPAQSIPIFGLDALSSAAYGPEAALTILLPLGLAGLAYIVPPAAVWRAAHATGDQGSGAVSEACRDGARG